MPNHFGAAFGSYVSDEELRASGEQILFRGRHREDGRSILMVTSASDHPSLGFVEKLETEWALRDHLALGWSARPVRLLQQAGRWALILDDPGGRPLDVVPGPWSIRQWLRVAIGISSSLSRVHESGLVHKDLKPANILVDIESGTASFMGFGIATRLPRERTTPHPPEAIAGTLSYMAPEQTGRMNRSVDSRSDLYSLGVVLYEMLTGALPFTATDSLDLIHCHMARQPPAPVKVVNEGGLREAVPGQLSAIVMKLLAKTAEDRYQTARGLELDLRRCLENWESKGDLGSFALAEHDGSDQLLTPETLYGRDTQRRELLETCERAFSDGRTELVLISGAAGVGKSSLVNELHKTIVTSRGFFATGKFEQYKRGIPYLRAGAIGKVEQLDREYPGIEKQAPVDPNSTIGGTVDHLDLPNVIKASQAVSEEIVLGRLIEKLVRIVVDHAGADRGLLILREGDDFVIEAEATMGSSGVEVVTHRVPAASGELPESLFRYVVRTGESVILDDASVPGLFAEDEYLSRRKSRSVLCLPLLKQTYLVGVLYLENGLTPQAFTPTRIATLKVLASQAAIALENARLYSELRAFEERFSKAFHDNPTPMAVIRRKDGTFVDANESLLRLLGYSRAEILEGSSRDLGQWFVDLLARADRRLAAGESFRDRELSASARSGESLSLLTSIDLIEIATETCFLATFVDLTERKRVDEQLRQSQKMDAIGSLAGGIAHDFNNLLTAINGFSELALMEMDHSHRTYGFVRSIRTNGERAAGLTRQLLSFSRKETVQARILRLNDVVKGMEEMFRRLIEENLELTLALGLDVGLINADRGQVEQILMNLVVNARDAMPKGGKLVVETKAATVDGRSPDILLEPAPGRYVCLSVSDTGTGIAPDLAAKIFEPFFTTKEVGKGTGLGLAVVYGLVKQHGGGIAVTSSLGQGTTFSIYFPDVSDAQVLAPDPVAGDARGDFGGTETILVVEDEASVRQFIDEALESQGYTVLDAKNGREALELLKTIDRRIDLLLTDMIMPDMGGRELADHARKLWPSLPVLFTSGYSKDLGIATELLSYGEADSFIAKPFGPTALTQILREALDRAKAQPA